ncbi:MAG: energy transducer TonB [Pseudomonadota bacterium]
MKSKTLLIPAIGLMATITTPAFAQDQGKGEVAIPPPAPPALRIPPPAPPAPPSAPKSVLRSREAPPRLISYQAIDAKPADYPPQAWKEGQVGSVRFELAVDATGKPTQCTILESSESELLDAKTCEIAMARAEFEPALDVDGNPVAGVHRDYQVWSMRRPQFGPNTVVDVSFTLTEDGEVLNCQVIEISGELSERMRKSFEREPCPGMNRPPRAVYRDENGNPVAKQVRLKVLVDVTDPPAPE